MEPYLYHRNCKNFIDVCHGSFGRKVIFSDKSIITKGNVIEELGKVLYIHNQNRREVDYLYNYVAGDQPILYRQKEVRPEIKNNTVENHALEITRFMIAQNFGEPIKYVLNATDPDEEKSKEIDELNKMMEVRNKSYFDIQIGDWRSTCGTSYRETWSISRDSIEDGEPLFDMDVLDPRYNFVVYSKEKGHPPLYSVSIGSNEKGNEIKYVTTKASVFEINGDKVTETINGHGKLLIVEYPNNARRLSDVEIVITMLDAINRIQSNRVDGIEQFVQAFIKFVNCEIDESEFLKMCRIGAISVKTVNPAMKADVGMVNSELNQEQTQVAKNDIYKNILIVEGMPGREQNTGGDTGQAVYLRNGWDFAEQRAKIDEPVIVRSEREFLKVVLNILKTKQVIKKLNIADIGVKITRNKTDNMLVKAQALTYLLAKGIHPKIAIQTCDLWGDPNGVYDTSKPYLDAIYKTAKEMEKSNSDTSANKGGDVIV